MSNGVFTGICFGPGGETGERCQVRPEKEGLAVELPDGRRVIVSYREMAIAVTGMDDKYLSFEGAAADGVARKILVADKEIASRVRGIAPSRAVLERLEAALGARRKRRSGRLAVLGAVAAVLLALVLLAWAAFGWAVDAVVDTIPPSWETELGRATAAQVLSEHQVCADPALEAAVAEIGRRLVVGMGRTPYEWRIRVLDDPDVNAFALPGGYVFINRGLIERANDGHEVAGVVAHELRHVLSRHGVRNLVREVGLALIVQAALGDASAAQRFVLGNAAALTSMSYSRDQEREADEGALAIVYRAGLEPNGLERFMLMLAKEEGLAARAFGILSTHPASEDRAEEIEELIRAWGPATVTPLEADWALARGACGPVSMSDPDLI